MNKIFTCNRSNSISIEPYNVQMRSHLVWLRYIERRSLEPLGQQATHPLLQLYRPLARIQAESVQAIFEVMKIRDAFTNLANLVVCFGI